MATLAPKLPWQHAFAGGYPGRSGQALPTDPDAIDYLNRVAAADGASVEVGIAQAIDAFVRGCKADSAGYAGDPTRTNWDAIQASCIMCGARTLSGALVPLKGAAPTGYGSWASGDYSRSGATPGLKGNGSTKYLDTNRAGNADGQSDVHISSHVTVAGTAGNRPVIVSSISYLGQVNPTFYSRLNQATDTTVSASGVTGFVGASRQLASTISTRLQQATSDDTKTSITPGTANFLVFRNSSGTAYSDARIAFYSVGSAIDLAAMDERVTNLVTAIRFHTLTGLLPNDYDPATIAYITAAYAAGGTL